MPDELKNCGELDGARVDVNREYEVRYWTKELGIDEKLLKEAVQRVGPSAAEIRRFLDRRQSGF